jgi:hypothetical protein
MKVKVISNGKRSGTVLINAETGEVIDGVRSITWSIAEVADNAVDESWGAAWLSKLVVTIYGVELELTDEWVGESTDGAQA